MPLVTDLSAGLLMAEHHPLRLAALLVFHLIIRALIQVSFHQLGLGNIIKNCVQHLLKVKMNKTHYSALIQSQ